VATDLKVAVDPKEVHYTDQEQVPADTLEDQTRERYTACVAAVPLVLVLVLVLMLLLVQVVDA
jgi:hypothetical protein